MNELVDVRFVNVFHPRREYDRQARPVRDVVLRAQFVLDVVAGPVADASRVQQVVVRDGARPHDLGADVVIGRIFEGHRAVVENGADGSLDQAVGEIDVFYPREITLH